MRNFFIFLFLILLVPVSTAFSFSPSSLIFNLEPGQQECQEIFLNAESSLISISDAWAENPGVDWKVSAFNTPAKQHRLILNYPDAITTESQVQVCISGNKSGEYHGAIILQEQQQENSIIQYGIWLKVIISGTPEEVQEQISQQTSSENLSETASTQNLNADNEELEFQNLSAENSKQQTLLTENAINTPQKTIKFPIILTLIIIILIIIYARISS